MKKDVRESVRKGYAAIAKGGGSCCGPSKTCCGTKAADAVAKGVGYSDAELATLPEGANMGLSCGNPTALAALKPGEVVLDLGSGGGFDVFLVAQKVGPNGRAIGVDMTPEMISKARGNLLEFRKRTGLNNVEFRLGEIEHLPVADASVDVVISNCVINLSPDKEQVYREAYRVLKPGGRLAISDVVAVRRMPGTVTRDFEKRSGCVAGAAPVRELERILRAAGFRDVCVAPKEESVEFIKDWFPGSGVERYVRSAEVRAVKPRKKR